MGNVTPINIHVAVPCRNRRLFRRVFPSHRVVSLNFIKGRAHVRFVDLLDIHVSTKHIWALPLMEVQRYGASKAAIANEIRNGITFDFYMELPHIWLPLQQYSLRWRIMIQKDRRSNGYLIRLHIQWVAWLCGKCISHISIAADTGDASPLVDRQRMYSQETLASARRVRQKLTNVLMKNNYTCATHISDKNCVSVIHKQRGWMIWPLVC